MDQHPDDAPPRPRRRVTIADVAAEAGVSTAAVSKVLREAYGVSEEMRTKVGAAIETLDYRPHAGARTLRGRSYTIGVMLLDLGAQFQSEIVRGISAHLESGPFQEVLITAGIDPARQIRAIEALADRQMDGLIVITPHMEAAWLESLGRRIPLVTIARHGPVQHHDAVVADDRLGAQLVVDHLVQQGHRRIMHISSPAAGLSPPSVLPQTPRAAGFAEAMHRRSLAPWTIEAHFTEAEGREATLRALDAENPPTAIFAGSDDTALGVLAAAEESGLDVPGDLSVVGYDNTRLARLGRIGLTTVDQQGADTGAVAADLLLERIDGRAEPVRRVITPMLVERTTTGAPSQ